MIHKPPTTDQPLPHTTEPPDILAQVQRLRERLAHARLERDARLARAPQAPANDPAASLFDPFI